MSVVIKTDQLLRKLTGEVPITLVDHADLEIKKGEFISIIGPSGSGKSSLLYLLGLLDIPTGGKVWLHGRDMSLCSESEMADIRLSEIGFVFQFHFLLPEFTALENVMLPMQRLGRTSNKDTRARAIQLLGDLGLSDQHDKLPSQLSGGQSQRVAIARALANDPVVILADEPTGNLDSVSSEGVQKILRTLAHEHGRTVVAVTHDRNFADSADRVITIVDGKIVPPEEL
jgi:lipoprotein-releasing system ATP-binding protein